MTAHPPSAGGAPRREGSLLGWLGLALHGATGIVPYAGSGLVAPTWGVVLLWAVWAALLVVALVLIRRRPRLVLLIPATAIAAWASIVSLGDLLLGWTA